jgi:hypothetical protein
MIAQAGPRVPRNLTVGCEDNGTGSNVVTALDKLTAIQVGSILDRHEAFGTPGSVHRHQHVRAWARERGAIAQRDAALSVVRSVAAGAAALAPRGFDEAVDLTVATLHIPP